MNNVRHIIYINEFFHPDVCASAAVISEQLPRLRRRRSDLQITVIAGNRAWDEPRHIYPAEDEYQGVHVLRVPRPAVSRTNLLLRGLGFLAFGRGVVRVARSLDRVDLVIGTTAPPHGGLIARRIAEHRRCPFIYRVLDLYPDLALTLGRLKPESRMHRLWLKSDVKTMRRAAAVVTVGARITQRIAETRGIPAERLHTLHDGFDPARLDRPAESRNTFRSEYNPDGRFVVQYAGNMGLSHPLASIVAATRELEGDSGVLFQFIGDGPGRACLENISSDNVQLIPYQPPERLGEVLATADLCLISQHDRMFDKSLPYKIYAILAAGKPAVFIGSDRSEIVQWLVERDAGVHLGQDDPGRLIGVIRDFRDTPDRGKRMGIAGRAMLNHRFHADIVARQWSDIIDAALGARAGTPRPDQTTDRTADTA